ncbi:MAG TPA: hypothetical protein P5233_20490, partial [Candidatus Paceibacterota bacterium]|nr:hypothetical protein [Candidatus Paceibacterota bacterium]
MKKSMSTPLDLSRWRKVPLLLTAGGGLVALLGLLVNREQFAFSWLLAFMFFLSLSAGALFLVMAHHLFDAGWSVPLRRFLEHLANLFPWLAVLFVPIALLAPTLYQWMSLDPHLDHALHAKQPLFTRPMFYAVAAICFGVWIFLSNRLRHWSLEQDRSGAALPTHRMRFYSCVGIFLFAITLTLAAIMWMKALQHQWFSTMYGVYYFAGSVWMTLGTAYLITLVLDRQGVLTDTLHDHQYYFLGSLLFAFTVFYAYIHFSQYFIIWNGNMPEETFWYVLREKGTWWWVGMVIIFGHFFLPFLALLRIDVKSMFGFMAPLCGWTWLMHYLDLSFNIMPVKHPDGFVLHWIDLGCWAFMAGLLTMIFLREYGKHPPYPLKDPRLVEAMGFAHPIP